jgi:hypothetical protein
MTSDMRGLRPDTFALTALLGLLTGIGLTMPQALAGAIVGYFLTATAWPLMIAVAGTGIATLAVWAATARIRALPGRWYRSWTIAGEPTELRLWRDGFP